MGVEDSGEEHIGRRELRKEQDGWRVEREDQDG